MNMHSLSRPRRQLVKVMQHLQFGWIGGLRIEHGEPVLRPCPRVVRTVALGHGADSEILPPRRDFVLKRFVMDLFELFDRNQSLEIERLDIHDGLPTRVQFDDQSARQMLDTVE